jgi:uncharacterized protein YcbX
MDQGAETPRVTALWLYPVKGLRGRPVATAHVEPWGLAGDRRWMVVDASGTFLTQRQLPRMATLEAEPTDTGLRLRSATGSLVDVETPTADVMPVEVRVWRDRALARPSAHDVDRWLSAELGVPCRLVHQHEPSARGIDPVFGRAADRVSFADGYPLLLTNEASLVDLTRRASCSDTPMSRFRPNLVVAGAAPWAEDAWRVVRVRNVSLRAAKPCGRCIVVTTDQVTGHRAGDGEPLRTLASFRRDESGRIVFGQNLIPDGTGSISVGDALTFDEEA